MDQARLGNQEGGIQDVQIAVFTGGVQEPALAAVRAGDLEDEGVECVDGRVEIEQHAFGAATDHDGLGGESHGVQCAGRERVDVHVGTGTLLEGFTGSLRDEAALFIPLDPVRDIFPDGEDFLFVTFHALKGGLQFFGVAEARLDRFQNVRFGDGMIHVTPG